MTSTSILAVLRFFNSLAALFQGTYPEIFSGGAPRTFVHAVFLGVCQNQSKFEAKQKLMMTLWEFGGMLPWKFFENLIVVYIT